MIRTMISSIYEGPMVAFRSNGTSKARAKQMRGNRSSHWTSSATNKPSDRKRKPQMKRIVSYAGDVHTPQGVIRGLNVKVNAYGHYVTLGEHEIKVTPIGAVEAGVWIMKGIDLSECKVSSFHPYSPFGLMDQI